SMAPRLSTQLRERIVAWREHFTIAEIANLAACSIITVYDILALYHQTGSVHPLQPSMAHGHPCTLNQDDLGFIHDLCTANPGIYLDEIQTHLWDDRGVD
ncbi:hypothetical protein OF83DRAFT_1032302, partial [Amylostereum chailletii]